MLGGMSDPATAWNRQETRAQAAARQKAALDEKTKTDAALAGQRASEEGHRNLLEQLAIANAGGINANLPPQGDVPDRPGGRVTLQQDLANPAVPENGQGQTITDARGGKHYMQTPQDRGNAFVPTGGLAGALQSAGWDGKTPITPEHSHAIMQALEMAQPKDEAWDYDGSGKYLDAQGKPAPVMIGRTSHTVKFLNYGAQSPAAPPQAQPAATPNATPTTTGGAPGGPFTAQAPTPQQSTTMPGGPGLPAFQVAQPPAASPTPPMGSGAPGGAFAQRPETQDAVRNLQMIEDRSDADRQGGTPGGPFNAPTPAAPSAAPVPPSKPTQPGGVSFALPEKNEPLRIIPGKKGPNGGMIVMNEKTNKTYEVPYPEGTTDELTANQKEQDADRHVRQAEIGNAAAERNDSRATRIAAELARHNTELTTRKEKAKANLKAALKGEGELSDEDKNNAAHDYKQELQQAQSEYETNVGTTLGKKIDHNPWADQLPDGATPPAKTSAAPAQGGKPTAPGPAQRTPPPAGVTKGLAPGTHTFGNGQTWKKNADGSIVYVSGGK
jgi:hypothetical protein